MHLKCKSSDTVRKLISRIRKNEKRPDLDLMLRVGGKKLKNRDTLAEAGVGENATVEVAALVKCYALSHH